MSIRSAAIGSAATLAVVVGAVIAISASNADETPPAETTPTSVVSVTPTPATEDPVTPTPEQTQEFIDGTDQVAPPMPSSFPEPSLEPPDSAPREPDPEG